MKALGTNWKKQILVTCKTGYMKFSLNLDEVSCFRNPALTSNCFKSDKILEVFRKFLSNLLLFLILQISKLNLESQRIERQLREEISSER